MEQRTIYVVMGLTGEYSDRSEWPVRAFLSQSEAESLIAKASARAKTLGVHEDGDVDFYRYRNFPADIESRNEHDPNMRVDYTGVSYYCMEVPLVGADETIETIVEEERARAGNLRAIALSGDLDVH